MELKKIRFAAGEDGAQPISIAVEMTIEEAIWIAAVAGKQRGESPHTEIYGVLTSDVFNRYWEDGLADASSQYHVEIPPVRYED